MEKGFDAVIILLLIIALLFLGGIVNRLDDISDRLQGIEEASYNTEFFDNLKVGN